MPRQPRRQFLVNSQVQGSFVLRVAIYWAFCLLAVALMTGCWMVLFDRPASSGDFLLRMAGAVVPTLLASSLLLPIALMDGIRYSNRFVGPIFRLGRAMSRLADGERVHNIEFRQGDFWFEFAQTFNRLNERVIRLEEQAKAATAKGESHIEDETPVAVG